MLPRDSQLTLSLCVLLVSVAKLTVYATFFHKQQPNYYPIEDVQGYEEEKETYEKEKDSPYGKEYKEEYKEDYKEETPEDDCKCECPKTKYDKVEVPQTKVKYYPISEPKDDEQTSPKSAEPFKPVIQREIYKELGDVLDKLDDLSRNSHKENMKYMKEQGYEEHTSGQISYGSDEKDSGDGGESISRGEPESRFVDVEIEGNAREALGNDGSSESDQLAQRYADSQQKNVNDEEFDWMKQIYGGGSGSKLEHQTAHQAQQKPRRVLPTATTSTTTRKPKTTRPGARSQLREFKRPNDINEVKKRTRVVRLQSSFNF